MPEPPTIGTLNEGPLHQALKELYALEHGAVSEVSVGSYVADLQGSDGALYEIQTGSFSAIKRKLRALVESHKVVLVHPIPAVRTLVKLPTEEGGKVSRRKSPKRGAVADVLSELVYLPTLLEHPLFELEVVMTEEEEIRVHEPKRIRRRRGWRVVERRLLSLGTRHRFERTHDLFNLLEEPLEEPFTTAELAHALARPRWLAQKFAYVLRESGAIEVCGKSGNALVYRRPPSTEGPRRPPADAPLRDASEGS